LVLLIQEVGLVASRTLVLSSVDLNHCAILGKVAEVVDVGFEVLVESEAEVVVLVVVGNESLFTRLAFLVLGNNAAFPNTVQLLSSEGEFALVVFEIQSVLAFLTNVIFHVETVGFGGDQNALVFLSVVKNVAFGTGVDV